MVEFIEKDILDVKSGIIVQFCNCMGVMGAGLSKKISDKWPVVKTQYKEYLKNYTPSAVHALGTVNFVCVNAKDQLYICNAITQYGYGTKQRQTEYSAVIKAMLNLRNKGYTHDIYIPFNAGCGLGGGDWDVVYSIIEYYFGFSNSIVELNNVYICKL